MRTAPPVLPDRDDAFESEQSWLQRQGADVGLTLHTLGYLVLIFAAAMAVGFLAAKVRGMSGSSALACAFTVATVLTAGAGFFILEVSGAAGDGALAVVMPSGAGAPFEEQFSYRRSSDGGPEREPPALSSTSSSSG
ncbi:MAG TPA: hypothetical protein VGP25_01225 [Gemmatimonadaceae bacterium]|jgi:hypothetical protein|nr:hypothetical protein [Gemmatimonadaceae bacterium]